jgi:hypothetical protein
MRFNPASSDFQMLSNATGDHLTFWNGTSRTNASLDISDTFSSFESATGVGSGGYTLYVRYTNPTTTGTPSIGSIGFEAEDSANVFSAYGGIQCSIADDTSTSRDGVLRLLVASASGTANRTLGGQQEVFAVEGGNGTPKIGFFAHARAAQTAAYTVTNPTTDRALNVTADTLAQGLQVLGTLILDLQAYGLIG